MKTYSDDELNALLLSATPYSVVIIRSGPNYADDQAVALSWEHNRRNFGLRDQGLQVAYLRVLDDSDIYGVEVLDVTVDDAVALMDDDPAVAAGVLAYEVHPCRGFPGGSVR